MAALEQPRFGLRLRSARRLRGLSQVDVAGDTMSASYISLVESGRRTPSAEIAQTIAERLGVGLEELTAREPDPADRDGRLGLVSQLIMARSARMAGEYEHARDILDELSRRPGGPDEEDVIWEASWELSATLGRLGESDRRNEVLGKLLNDPLTLGSPHLHAHVAATVAEAARKAGKLVEATNYAERAMAAAEPLDANSTEWVQSRVALIAAHAESGVWERAAGLSHELLEVLDDVMSRQLRGIAYWTTSCVALLCDDPDRALADAERAGDLLRPAIDVELWARFQRATGSLLIARGDLTRAEAVLRRARLGLELTGSAADLAFLSHVEAAAHCRGGDFDAAVAAVAAAGERYVELPDPARARCDVFAGRTYRAARRNAESADRYASAAAHYERAGCYRLANEVWRESTTKVAPYDTPHVDHHSALLP